MNRDGRAGARIRALGWPLLALALAAVFYVGVRAAVPIMEALPTLPGPLPGTKGAGAVQVTMGKNGAEPSGAGRDEAGE